MGQANTGSISRADEWRRKAEQAEALAEAAQDQEAKQTYQEVAQQWRKLAEQAERNHS